MYDFFVFVFVFSFLFFFCFVLGENTVQLECLVLLVETQIMFRKEKQIRIIRRLSYWLEKVFSQQTLFELFGFTFRTFLPFSTIVCLVCVLFSGLTQTLLPAGLSPPGQWLIVQSWLTVFEITFCTEEHLCLLKLS